MKPLGNAETSSNSTQRLAEEQAALLRVATLVASAPKPEQVFEAVAEEAGRLLRGQAAVTARAEPDFVTIVGHWHGGKGGGYAIGAQLPYSAPDSPLRIAATEGGRIGDYTDVPGEAARLTREGGYRSAVVAPITVGGRHWGTLFVYSATPHHFGPGDESRLRKFTRLVSLALESAEAQDQLTASRARIVEAAVGERRRLERNLHDGAQQRLVTLALHLRMVQECVRDDPARAEKLLAEIGGDLRVVLDELRELARGLHPAILTDRGLVPALQSLAARAPFPVEIRGVPGARASEAVEAAIYYVVAESLTNVAKHASAAGARIELSAATEAITVKIIDSGGGGATFASGSGLRGLADRVEALGGTFELESPAGQGTVVSATVPVA